METETERGAVSWALTGSGESAASARADDVHPPQRSSRESLPGLEGLNRTRCGLGAERIKVAAN